MKLFDDYLKLQQEIYDYFGYKEGWRILPLNDLREFWWYIPDADTVVFADTEEIVRNEDGAHYCQEIYHQIIHRGKDFTAIAVDTNCDGNKFLQIFDNSKEVK